MKKLLCTIALLLASICIFTACGKLSLPSSVKKTAAAIIQPYEESVRQLDGLSRETTNEFLILALHGKTTKADAIKGEDYDFSPLLFDPITSKLALSVAKATITQYAMGETMEEANIKAMLSMPANEGSGWDMTVPAYTLLAATIYGKDVEAEYTKQKLITILLSKQKENGGFSNTEFYDVDSTAMILTSLAMHKEEPRVKAAVEKGITFLQSVQDKSSAGFFSTNDSTWGAPEVNTSSTAQAMIALICNGIDPFKDKRFIHEKKTMYDFLLTLKRDDNTMANTLSTLEISDLSFSTPQMLLALACATKYDKTGKHLYDFS